MARATSTATKPAAAKPAADNGSAAPKKGPNFEMKPVSAIGDDGKPAANPPTTRVGGRTDLIANLLKLQDTPNVWVEVVHYAAKAGTENRPAGARKTVTQFLEGKIKAPADTTGNPDWGYDVEWRDAKYDGSDREGSVVIALYGPPPAE